MMMTGTVMTMKTMMTTVDGHENDIEYDEPGHHLPVLHHASQHMPWNDKSVFEEYDNDYFEKNYHIIVSVKLPCKDRGKLATWRTPVRREVKGQNFAVLFQPDKLLFSN